MTPMTRIENFLARAAGDQAEELVPVTRIEQFLQKIIDNGSGGGSQITVDDALSTSSENPVQNKVVTTALNAKADAATVSTVSGATPTITPANNTIYECGELTSLTISNPPATGSYSIVFTSGSTATTTTIPATVKGLESFTAAANTRYEINVLDNYALVAGWVVSTS